MKLFLFLLFLLPSYFAFGQSHEICVSVDDLPFVSYGDHDPETLESNTRKLLNAFQLYEIPAIGFVNEKKLYAKNELDPNGVGLLKIWLNNGFELGNHSFSHFNYHRTDFSIYTQDILKGEKISKALSEQYALPYRYYRHPFLRLGRDKAHHDSLRQFLHKHAYEEAPVSIDNEDYLFAKAYAIADKKGDQALMERIGKDYVAYMLKKLSYFERNSRELFGRNIKHILLIHANKLNADYFASLAEGIKEKGYVFISMQKALEDSAYQTPISKYGDWGISWIDRWALSAGKKGSFFKAEPLSPDYIQKMAK